MLDCDNDIRIDIVAVNEATIDRFLASGDAMITFLLLPAAPRRAVRPETLLSYSLHADLLLTYVP